MPHDPGLPEPASSHSGQRRSHEPIAGRIDPPAAGLGPPSEGDLPPALVAAPDFGSLVRALRRRWATAILLGGTLAAIAAVGVWFALSPKYTAFSRVHVDFNQSPILKDTVGTRSDFATYMRTQVQQIMSRPVIWAALRTDEVKRLALDNLVNDPAQYIEEELKVDLQENSEMLSILLGSFDPNISVALVKAITDSYMSEVVYKEEQARIERVNTLEKAYNDSVNRLKTHQEALDKQARDLGLGDPATLMVRYSEYLGAIRDLQSQRNHHGGQVLMDQGELDALDARLRAHKDPKATPPNLARELKADPDIRELMGRLERLEDYLSGVNIDSPTGAETARKVAALQARILRRRKEIEDDLRAHAAAGTTGSSAREELEANRRRLVNRIANEKVFIAELQKEIDRLNQERARLATRNAEYESGLTQLKAEQRVVDGMGLKLQEEKVELKAKPRIRIFQPAELQKKDIKKQVLATAAAPLGVLFVVCAWLAWAEHRQRRVLKASEIAGGLGIRVIGAVPEMAHLEHQLVGPDGETELEGHPVLESIDAIRTALLHAAGVRVVLVTSATSGEGKTTLAAHLAGSLARAGRKTLLIDGDLRTPTAHQLFELPPQPGFSEALLGEVEVAEAIRPTPLEGLWFLAAGQWDREVMQALARGDLEGTIDKLREEFDFVIIDSHPVLAATDSLLLGRQADAVLLSVLRDVSQMPRVYAAVQRLTGLGIRVLGAVVNGADPEEALPPPNLGRVAA